ncbi:MAG: hypothetical protein HETSPECPRED_008198 [Heterodermia speciosa]|uniref:Uncharacterized protein n=1 Tax=Heterodermia speciosa TaxID=116794 RepID=A0A8H3IY17_9LECA|nr:MAG: hypothetical protein HETSPECPRED_008198 [Heterodermia speciosa]
MLVLPVRSPQHPHSRQNLDDDPRTSSPQRQRMSDTSLVSNTTLHTSDAILPATSPRHRPKRPKLSLQTSNVSSLPAGHRSKTAFPISTVRQSATSENSLASIVDAPSHTAVTPQAKSPPIDIRSVDIVSFSPTRRSTTTSSSGCTSPFPATTPYYLPMGARSILRNSPLPPRSIPSTGPKTAKVLFPRIKHVCFRERLEELIPAPTIDQTHDTSDLSDSDTSDKRLEDEIAERKALDNLLEEEEGNSTAPVRGRRKPRKRDWIWRPLEDNISASQSPSACRRGEDVRHCRRVPESK